MLLAAWQLKGKVMRAPCLQPVKATPQGLMFINGSSQQESWEELLLSVGRYFPSCFCLGPGQPPLAGSTYLKFGECVVTFLHLAGLCGGHN